MALIIITESAAAYLLTLSVVLILAAVRYPAMFIAECMVSWFLRTLIE
jgi:hypothetical protein